MLNIHSDQSSAGNRLQMNFQDLQELLRLELMRRIELGMLTGSGLARQAGFRQAHISNYLRKKRALSLDGLDRVLAAQNISLDQIVPLELAAASSTPSGGLAAIPVVSALAAMNEPVVRPGLVIETVQVAGSRLPGKISRPSRRSAHWQRFVGIRVDGQQAGGMEPVIVEGAIVVLDRHCGRVAPNQRNLFGVRGSEGLVVRSVEMADRGLVLRPVSHDYPVELLALAAGETAADYIVGRVCLTVSEF
jgi:transcriptional regulator with XRE-family HTH domain